VREWLISHGFMGKEGQLIPDMTDEVVLNISERYQELYQQVTGNSFVPDHSSAEETESRIIDALKKL
ncbi:MAG TPA: phosphoribosylaminoimidazolesuccinocarboxamide synthase, partial [Chitinophagales bacterium]|nr:phosphoribosylaminoimidazolesuccinocarboxamide synthase [Chitinophagales bacterium]